MAQQTYFFDSSEGDNFMIPVSKRDSWSELSNLDFEDQDNCDRFEDEFGEYRTAGGISHIEFIPTKTDD